MTAKFIILFYNVEEAVLASIISLDEIPHQNCATGESPSKSTRKPNQIAHFKCGGNQIRGLNHADLLKTIHKTELVDNIDTI